MTKDKLFDEVFNACAKHVELFWWNFIIDFKKDCTDGYDAEVKKKDYTHFICEISFNEKMKDRLDKEDLDGLCKLIIHELCHIYTGAGSTRMKHQEEYLEHFLGKNQVINMYNETVRFEEQMTNLLDRIFCKTFRKTKSYKELKKLIKK